MSIPAPSRQPRVAPRRAPSALQRARLTVVPRARRSATRVPFVSLVTLVLLGGVVGLLLFNTSMQQASFATTALESQATNLAARQQTLQAELDELRSPQSVAERALELGMVVPSVPAFLDLRTGEVTGGRPAGAPEDRLRLRPLPPPKPQALREKQRSFEIPAGPGAGSAQDGSRGARNGGSTGPREERR